MTLTVKGMLTQDKTTTNPATTRDQGLDALRALAVLRVFLWHATGWAALTWIGALPVMFFVTGSLFATSADRHGVRRTLADRARRLLLPYWAFAVIMLVVMYAFAPKSTFPGPTQLVGWLLPVIDPVGAPWQQGWITEPLWYLRTYTWLLLAAPIALWLLRRGRGTLLLTSLALLSFLGQITLGTRLWALQDLVTYGFFFALGAASALGLFTMTRTRLLTAAGIALGAALLTARISPPLSGVVNNAHFLHLLVGVGWLSIAHLALGALRNAQRNDRVRAGVRLITTRSLSIYLWHAPLVGATYLLAGRMGLGTGLWQTILVTALGGCLTIAVVRIVGVIEDLAGAPGRRRVQAPTRRQLVAAACSGLIAVAIMQQPAPARFALPPTPSKAPDAATFSDDETTSFLLAPSAPLTQSAYTDESSLSGAALTQAISPQRRGERPRQDGNKPATPVTVMPPTTITPPTTIATNPQRTPSSAWAIPAIGAWNALASNADDALVNEVQRLAAEWVRNEKNPSVEIAILQPGRMRVATAVDRNGDVVTPADMIPLASVTKSFTAAIILRAAEEGRIDLNQPVGRLGVAPWFDIADTVTIAQLLSHRSGIANYTNTKAWERDWQSIDGWGPALRAAQETGLVFAPGSKVEYSSTNFIVAGLLAAQIYDRPIEKLIAEQILDPLGLNQTRVGMPTAGAPGTGTGNMHAHITDVARWGMAMWRNQIVMGPYANQLAAYTDPRALLGYGSFAWCPCRSVGGVTLPAAMGTNGAEATLRYYAATDTIIVLRISNGVTASVEGLINDLLTLTR